jgi:adenylyltransferase/sulfurtransferase
VLLRDVLCAQAFWREEMVELKKVTSGRLQETHRQSPNWQWVFYLGQKLGRMLHSGVRRADRGRESWMSVPEIRVEELKKQLDAGENLFLLDVRDEHEYEISNIGGQLIPLAELSSRVNELDAHRKIVTICKMGPRGAKAVQVLQEAGFTDVWNVRGGIHAWSDRVDPSVPKY